MVVSLSSCLCSNVSVYLWCACVYLWCVRVDSIYGACGQHDKQSYHYVQETSDSDWCVSVYLWSAPVYLWYVCVFVVCVCVSMGRMAGVTNSRTTTSMRRRTGTGVCAYLWSAHVYLWYVCVSVVCVYLWSVSMGRVAGVTNSHTTTSTRRRKAMSYHS